MRKRGGESGFALLFVFALAAAVAMMLYIQLPQLAFEAQRDKEQLLIDRGEQYARAIQVFYRKTKQFPVSIDQLENFNNVRFLRKKYKDPMTGKDEWRLIHVGPGGMLTDSLVQKPPEAAKGQQQGKDGQTSGSGASPTGTSGSVQFMTRTSSPQGAELGYQAPQPAYTASGDIQANPDAAQQRWRRQRGALPPAGPGGAPMYAGAAGGYPQQQPDFSTPENPYGPQPGTPGAAQPQQGQPGQTQAQNPPSGVQPWMNPAQPGQIQPAQNAPYQPGQPVPNAFPQGIPGVTAPNTGQGTQIYGGMVPSTPGSTQQPGQQMASFGAQPVYGGQTANFGAQPVYGGAQAATQQKQAIYSGFGQSSFGQQGSGFGGGSVGSGPVGSVSGSGSGFGSGSGGGSGNSALDDINRRLRGGSSFGQGANFGGGIAGVASKFEGEGIKVYNERSKYNEWEFIYDIRKDTRMGMSPFGAAPVQPRTPQRPASPAK